MQLKLQLSILILNFIVSLYGYGQDKNTPSLQLGDPAPPLKVQWIKGEPITRFKAGQVYVLELWATWCAPCKAAMPGLSKLAAQYRSGVTILGVDMLELKSTPMQKVKRFVDSMGVNMDYSVVADDQLFMMKRWYEATKDPGIPKTFVIDQQGRLAWTGHPFYLDTILPQIVNKTWDIKKEVAARKKDKEMWELERKIIPRVTNFLVDQRRPNDPPKLDSAYLYLTDMVKKYPELTYAPSTSETILRCLLVLNQKKALEYGRTLVTIAPWSDFPGFDRVIRRIRSAPDSLKLSTKLYELAAQACQMRIQTIKYPQLNDMSKYYNTLARFYSLSNQHQKSVETQEIAIQSLKQLKKYSQEALDEYEQRLVEYKRKM